MAANDGSASARGSPTEALPGSQQAEMMFYIADGPGSAETGFDVVLVPVNDTTTLGQVLTRLLGAPGDRFVYGIFVTDAITSQIDRGLRIKESYFYGRHSNREVSLQTHCSCRLLSVIPSMLLSALDPEYLCSPCVAALARDVSELHEESSTSRQRVVRTFDID